ncbi:MAG: hypothetical protein J5I98_14195, partial [Phaeodactylibacter sp.]|nr:hypothetical protein [Phaeodactylibacter sp.]
PDLGSHEAIFSPRSGATGRKNGEVRFHRWPFAGQRIKSQHALRVVKLFFKDYLARYYNAGDGLLSILANLALQHPFEALVTT